MTAAWQTLAAAWHDRHMKTPVPIDNLTPERVYHDPDLNHFFRLLVVHDEWVEVYDLAAECRRQLNRMLWERCMRLAPEGSWLTPSASPATAAPSASSTARSTRRPVPVPTSPSTPSGRRVARGGGRA